MLSGVRSQNAVRIFGEDLDALRSQDDILRARLATIPGIVDLQIEKQVLKPQIKVRIDHAAAAQCGMASTSGAGHAAGAGGKPDDHANRRRQPALRAGGARA